MNNSPSSNSDNSPYEKNKKKNLLCGDKQYPFSHLQATDQSDKNGLLKSRSLSEHEKQDENMDSSQASNQYPPHLQNLASTDYSSELHAQPTLDKNKTQLCPDPASFQQSNSSGSGKLSQLMIQKAKSSNQKLSFAERRAHRLSGCNELNESLSSFHSAFGEISIQMNHQNTNDSAMLNCDKRSNNAACTPASVFSRFNAILDPVQGLQEGKYDMAIQTDFDKLKRVDEIDEQKELFNLSQEEVDAMKKEKEKEYKILDYLDSLGIAHVDVNTYLKDKRTCSNCQPVSIIKEKQNSATFSPVKIQKRNFLNIMPTSLNNQDHLSLIDNDSASPQKRISKFNSFIAPKGARNLLNLYPKDESLSRGSPPVISIEDCDDEKLDQAYKQFQQREQPLELRNNHLGGSTLEVVKETASVLNSEVNEPTSSQESPMAKGSMFKRMKKLQSANNLNKLVKNSENTLNMVEKKDSKQSSSDNLQSSKNTEKSKNGKRSNSCPVINLSKPIRSLEYMLPFDVYRNSLNSIDDQKFELMQSSLLKEQ